MMIGKQMRQILLGFGPIVVATIVWCSVFISHKNVDEKIVYKEEKSTNVVILDEFYYLSEMQGIAHTCKYNIECMEKNFKKKIPPQFEISAKIIKKAAGGLTWQFTCNDTSDRMDYYGK